MISVVVKGQERALDYLERTKRENKTPSLMIFHGPRGVGKTISAFQYAFSFNPGVFKSLVHPDLIVVAPTDMTDGDEIDENIDENLKEGKWRVSESPNSTIKIDQIRSVQKKLQFRPFSAKKRFVIVVDSHRMRTEAANAFLKTLEEPPIDTCIIMTTSHLSTLLPTVVSRGFLLGFRGLEKDIISKILAERYGVRENEARETASLSDGSLSKALEIVFDEEKKTAKKMFLSAFLSKDRKKLIGVWPSRITDREIVFALIETLHSLCADFAFVRYSLRNKLRNPEFADKIQQFARDKDSRYFYKCEAACMKAEKALELNIDNGLIKDYLIEEVL
ncbi:hypothetical protein JXA84_08185 [candidate division WOR-3 bacterium]|nr:hypothetical protein [candidate division WOR-3 bacterium]